jgi:RsbT co-antagonist protein rsbRD N-terminal domain
MSQIETHADELTERVIQAVRTSPRTSFLHELSQEELRRGFFDLYRNLGRWLSEKGESEIEATYGEMGRRRCREGVPLNELVYAVILVKQILRDYIQKNVLPESEANLYGEELVNTMVGTFFDRVLYHAVKAYEETWAKDASLRLLAGGSAQSGGATTRIARAILGELDARRGMLDNDLRLRSLTFVVKLEPAGMVRSITVQQESLTELGQR